MRRPGSEEGFRSGRAAADRPLWLSAGPLQSAVAGPAPANPARLTESHWSVRGEDHDLDEPAGVCDRPGSRCRLDRVVGTGLVARPPPPPPANRSEGNPPPAQRHLDLHRRHGLRRGGRLRRQGTDTAHGQPGDGRHALYPQLRRLCRLHPQPVQCGHRPVRHALPLDGQEDQARLLAHHQLEPERHRRDDPAEDAQGRRLHHGHGRQVAPQRHAADQAAG